MDATYEALSRRATKGEQDALRDLFSLAETLGEKGQIAEAMQAFKDAAIAFRIAAFRNLARAEEAEKSAHEWAQVVDQYLAWIDENPSGLRRMPRSEPSVDSQFIRRLVMGELQADDRCMKLFIALERELKRAGMEFYSPGGSPLRRICILLDRAFGLEPQEPELDLFLSKVGVRVFLDQIADEIARRRKDETRSTISNT